MVLNNIDLNHPIVFGIIATLVTYIICYLDVRLENKKLNLEKSVTTNNCTCPDIKVSLKLPLIIGGIVWAAATYFKTLSTPTDMVGGMLNLNESSSIFDPELEMLSEIPNFD